MTKRKPEFDGFSAYFAVRAETDRKGKATPPARTETRFGIRIQEQPFISTHSAREDGDFTFISVKGHSGVFQPTPPARTETMQRKK